MENSSVDQFRTNDMAMAAYLRMNGHSTQKIEWSEGTCRWFFLAVPALVEQVNKFLADTALVNPRQYNRSFAETKREFYESSKDNKN